MHAEVNAAPERRVLQSRLSRAAAATEAAGRADAWLVYGSAQGAVAAGGTAAGSRPGEPTGIPR